MKPKRGLIKLVGRFLPGDLKVTSSSLLTNVFRFFSSLRIWSVMFRSHTFCEEHDEILSESDLASSDLSTSYVSLFLL